tara:strand:- start:259 stop:642 length:384 start_codon:yes stop_codon:yes gene_type:complete
MQTQNIVVSFVAAEAITEFALVSIDTAGKIVITDAGTDAKCVGVAQRACSTGEVTDVLVHGVTRAISAGSLTFATNPILAATTNGKLEAVASSDYAVARILPNINQTSSAADEQINVLFFGPVEVKA